MTSINGKVQPDKDIYRKFHVMQVQREPLRVNHICDLTQCLQSVIIGNLLCLNCCADTQLVPQREVVC